MHTILADTQLKAIYHYTAIPLDTELKAIYHYTAMPLDTELKAIPLYSYTTHSLYMHSCTFSIFSLSDSKNRDLKETVATYSNSNSTCNSATITKYKTRNWRLLQHKQLITINLTSNNASIGLTTADRIHCIACRHCFNNVWLLYFVPAFLVSSLKLFSYSQFQQLQCVSKKPDHYNRYDITSPIHNVHQLFLAQTGLIQFSTDCTDRPYSILH